MAEKCILNQDTAGNQRSYLNAIKHSSIVKQLKKTIRRQNKIKFAKKEMKIGSNTKLKSTCI